jgi:hypothetical protein
MVPDPATEWIPPQIAGGRKQALDQSLPSRRARSCLP